jgi:hypothetical protein
MIEHDLLARLQKLLRGGKFADHSIVRLFRSRGDIQMMTSDF